MGVKIKNNAFGTLASGINNSVTTVALTSGQGAKFPTTSSSDYFYGTLIDSSNNLEVVKVTARSTDSMTVTRAQDNTSARAFTAGDRFELRPNAKLFEDIQTEARDLNGAEFILDADGDTTIHSSTDDQIDIKIGNADDFKFTANVFTAETGSGILLTKSAATSDEASSTGNFTENNYNISHTLTLDGTLANDAVLADFTVTSNKCVATSVVIATCSLKCHVDIHTVAAGSFKVSVTNKSGGTLANDSTMVLNYVIL